MEIGPAKPKLDSDRSLWPPSSRNIKSASRLRFLASRFPVLAEAPHRFAQAHRQRRDRLEALLAAAGKSSIIFAADFREQQLRVAQNSRQRIIQLVPQNFTERFRLPLRGMWQRHAPLSH